MPQEPTTEKTYVLFGEVVPASSTRYCQDCAFYAEPGRISARCSKAEYPSERAKDSVWWVHRTSYETCGQWEPGPAVQVPWPVRSVA